MTKVIRGAKVPRSASVCDENLTRRTRVIGRHGVMLIVEVRDSRGRKALRYTREAPAPKEMPEPPSPEEIAEWADGIVYAKLPSGEDIYFDVQAHQWRKVGAKD